MDRPDISVLSEEFLAEVRQLREKNLAVEALRKLLNGEIAARTRTNVVKYEEFSERLREATARHHNRSVEALQVIQELVDLARSLREQPDDGLSPEEKAFYDALTKNESAGEILGNAELLVELVTVVRERAEIDWWRRENVRSAMRIGVKRPTYREEAIRRVIQQAEALAGEFRRAA